MSFRFSIFPLLCLLGFLMFGLPACRKGASKPKGEAVSVKVEKHADGLAYQEGCTVPFSGEVLHFTIGGNRLLRESWKDGLPDGLWLRWAPTDGKLRKEQTFEKGRQVHQRQWHPNGKLKEDTQMRDGIAFGEVRLWWPDGRLRRSCTMEAGESVHGHLLQYDQNGKVIYDAIFDHGAYQSGKIPGEKLAVNAPQAAD